MFQYFNDGNANQPPTHVDQIDLIANTLTNLPDIPDTPDPHTINAVGYNVADNFMYGWDNKATPTTLARIHGDFTAERLTVTGRPAPADLNIVPAGDVDNNNTYWMAYFNPSTSTERWARIDLSTTTFTLGGTTMIGAGKPAGASEVLDWAYVPPTFLNDDRAGLYTVITDGGATQLYRFNITDPVNPAWEHIGPLPEMSLADGVVGALYADALGVLYAGSNNGTLWRIVIGNSTLGIDTEAFQLPTGSPANGNDGARCANAYPPVDFGDAPSTYDTKWEELGPLHAIGNFNESNSTAPLMLGTKIDMEPDGFPGASANGDDLDHNPPPPLNDEDSVQHIVAPPTPVDLKVPVTVTNTSSKPATLVGWIDSDNNGTFSNDPKVTQTIAANSNTKTYELTFSGLDLSANTFARFRVFEGTGLDDSILQPSGIDSAFTIGEVEDHQVQVGSFSVNKTADPPEGSTVDPGEILTYTLNVTNTGTTDLNDLTVHDDLSDVLDDATLEGNPVVDPGSAGSATVTGNTLEFKGDVPTGQSVKVTYKVKVKPAGQIGNNSMQNYVIAAQTNCHPTVNGGVVTVGHADCNTNHQVAGLANTGSNIVLPLVVAGSMIGAGAILPLARRRWVAASK